jgi:hypothetical protein
VIGRGRRAASFDRAEAFEFGDFDGGVALRDIVVSHAGERGRANGQQR